MARSPQLAPTVGVQSCYTGFQLHTVYLGRTPSLCVFYPSWVWLDSSGASLCLHSLQALLAPRSVKSPMPVPCWYSGLLPAFLSPGKPPHLLSALFRSPAPPRVTGRREQGSASCEDGVSLWLILLREATAWIEWDSLTAGLSFPLPLLHRPVRRV